MTDSRAPASRDRLVALLSAPEQFLDDVDPELRRLAVAGCADHPTVASRLTEMLRNDPDPLVRRECAETLGRSTADAVAPLEAALADQSSQVREAAAAGLGELAMPSSVPTLLERAADEAEDNLVREAAVAALGAIGDPAAIAMLLRLIEGGPPQVRRRCVAALSVFDGEDVEKALHRAAHNRNPMVREAAEMVVGRVAD
jgi:HEAT repeat protein